MQVVFCLLRNRLHRILQDREIECITICRAVGTELATIQAHQLENRRAMHWSGKDPQARWRRNSSQHSRCKGRRSPVSNSSLLLCVHVPLAVSQKCSLQIQWRRVPLRRPISCDKALRAWSDSSTKWRDPRSRGATREASGSYCGGLLDATVGAKRAGEWLAYVLLLWKYAVECV
jgi:hypothetical protein